MYQTIIIGSGFSGIDLAIQLKKRGVQDFVILEKATSLGGTWRENTYPGARCDIPSVLYSYSYEPNPDWDWKWSEQRQILDYMVKTAEKYSVIDHIQFQKELVAANWNEDGNFWEVKTKDGSEFQTKVLVTAIGQLHHPKVPNFEGLNDFQGKSWHSAQWNHEVSLKGKKVGVIGTGASAVQFIPEVAKEAKEVTVFQRTPNWVIPKNDRPLKAWEKQLFRYFPIINTLSRLNTWLVGGVLFMVLQGKIVGFRKLQEGKSRKHMRKWVKDKEKCKKLLPAYPMGTKRLLFSDNFFEAMGKEHVHLSTAGIQKITPNGILTKDQKEHDFDILIFGTGFKSNPFLLGLDIKGINGKTIKEHWKKEPLNYLGMSVNGFPNFFMMYGPNVNLGSNSMLLMLESQGKYIAQCVAAIKKNQWRSMEVKEDSLNNYYQKVQERLKTMLWARDENSWYKSESGIITNNWPGRTMEYARLTKKVNYSDYHVK